MKKKYITDSTFAMLCHLVSFTGLLFPLANIAAPFLIWLVRRKKSRLVDHHGRESMNFQISITIWFLLLTVLSFVLAFGDMVILTVGVVGLFFLIFCFLQILNAAASARKGEYATYPLTIRIIK